ncbi:MAG TPA: hypothetical protein DDZ51_20730, partial [Planctomycetaceae bacterium]|nr:hypothetical protein [Planctomycetaceae bacterium]
GWERKTLGDVCEIIMGTSPPGDTYNTTGQGVPLINGPVEFSPGSFGRTIRSKFTTAPNKLCKKNDLILCVRGSTTGKMNIAGFDACIGRGVAAIRSREYQPWVNHYVSSKTQDIYDLGTGSTFPNISISALSTLAINVPPLDEQQRIVGVLDEAFAGLATAQANAEKNLQNARALFESHLQSVFTQRGKGWVETTLDDEVEFAAGYAFKSSGYVKGENGTRLLRGDNIMQGEFRWDEAAYWPSEDTPTYDRFRLEENDIVLAMDRPWVAAGLKIACVSKTDIPCLQVQRTARLRVSNRLSWRYLFHLLRGQGFVSYLLDGQTGLGVPHISGKQILSFQFSRPSLAEQDRIANKLDALANETQILESIYRQKLAALVALKKSLLHQAFSGQL